MRLGQLARQLSIKTDEIVNFLGTQGITIDSGNNARIDDSYIEMILQRFAPGNENLKQLISEQPEVPEVEAETPIAAQDIPAHESLEESLPELIKAPKVELPGLRVLGKIELPEKKKAEPQPEKEEPEAAKRTERRIQRSHSPREQKNSVALVREREEREKKKKQEEQRDKDKQRKTEFYMKRLKPQAPTRSARIINEEYIEMPPLEPERPKTWLGRFKRWLNT